MNRKKKEYEPKKKARDAGTKKSRQSNKFAVENGVVCAAFNEGEDHKQDQRKSDQAERPHLILVRTSAHQGRGANSSGPPPESHAGDVNAM
jgi:hypothetical protein